MNTPLGWEARLRRIHLDPDPEYPRKFLEALARMWWTPLNYSADDFKKISAPTLVLMGEKDEMIPLDEAEEIAALIPGAQLAVIPGAKHNDVLARGGEFIEHLVDFFTEHLK